YELVKNAHFTEYGIVTEEKMWENFSYFIEKVMPVAEEANVKMALHPRRSSRSLYCRHISYYEECRGL
ncbi:MAG: mannonate dehydratase, partial [Candidatus Bathyarchaeia archaeon]